MPTSAQSYIATTATTTTTTTITTKFRLRPTCKMSSGGSRSMTVTGSRDPEASGRNPVYLSYGRELLPFSLLLFLWLLLLSASSGVHAIANTEPQSDSSDHNGTMNIHYNEAVPGADHSEPHLPVNRPTIVHLFEWKFSDVATECRNFLGPRGYGGVQLSPVTEHLIINNTAQFDRPWWECYHPISYKIHSRFGDEQEFMAMTRACNDAGVRVYVDVVMNHMAANRGVGEGDALGSAGSKARIDMLSYPAVPYTKDDFHRFCDVLDYSNAQEVRNCRMKGHPDLDHSRENVKTRLVDLLDTLVDMGVAGFRVDSAKYMWPIDLKKILNSVKNLNSEDFDFPENSRPFFYLDVVDLGVGGVSKTEYISYGAVTEYLYAAELSHVFNGQISLSVLGNWGPAMGFPAHRDTLVFVDSYDGQRHGRLRDLGENRLLTYKQRHRYAMANAFMLMHPYGRVKRIMSSYLFDGDDSDLGPPRDGDHVRSPEFDENGQCLPASGWVCEHRWPPLANLLAVVASFDKSAEDGGPVMNFQTHGPNQIAFCRGNKAFIAINGDTELPYAGEVQTCLPPGIYCDVISGGRAERDSCIGQSVTVNTSGYANITIPSVPQEGDGGGGFDELAANNANGIDDFAIIVIYVDSRLLNDEGSAGGNGVTLTTESPKAVTEIEERIDDDTDVTIDEIIETSTVAQQPPQEEDEPFVDAVEELSADVIKELEGRGDPVLGNFKFIDDYRK